MRALLVALLSVLVAGCGLSNGDGNRELMVNGKPVALGAHDNNPYEIGKQYLLSSNYGLAIGHFRAALRQDPASPMVLNAMAVAYDGLGRHDIARDFFTRALAADPQSVQTLNNMARSWISAGDADRALPYLKQAAALDPTNPIVLANFQAVGEVTPVVAGEIRSASLPTDHEGGWIERTSESQQTLVTRSSSLDAAAEDVLPPPTSFVRVASVEAAGAVKLASFARPAPTAAAVLPQTPRARRPSVAIANGNGRNGMAARVRGYLENKCWAIGRLQNADRFTYARTTIGYRTGFLTDAEALAAALPVTAEIVENASMESDIVLRIGRDFLAVESALTINARVKGKSYDQFIVSRDDRNNSADGSAGGMCGVQSADLGGYVADGRDRDDA